MVKIKRLLRRLFGKLQPSPEETIEASYGLAPNVAPVVSEILENNIAIALDHVNHRLSATSRAGLIDVNGYAVRSRTTRYSVRTSVVDEKYGQHKNYVATIYRDNLPFVSASHAFIGDQPNETVKANTLQNLLFAVIREGLFEIERTTRL
jgi:hypothetical protein